MSGPIGSPERARWFFPTLAHYRRRWLGADVVAGLSAGAVVVPQAMAYATIASLPVQVGLYTCMVPMLVYAMLGGSRAMSTSTTSTIATLTATTLVSTGVAAGSDDALGSLITLTLLCGLFLLILRLLRLGSIVESISTATVLGVQVGVGATVAVGQLGTLLGVDADPSGHGFVRSLASTIGELSAVNGPTVALSVGSIATLLLLNRFAPKVPGALLVVCGGILLSAFTGLQDAGVKRIDQVPQGLPTPDLPRLEDIELLVPGALAIALMAFLESIAVSRGIRDVRDPQIDSNRELLAVSTANIAGSFFTTLPAAGGFSQSAVNKGAGARSQLAQLVTVVLAVLVALLLGPVLSELPQATLASLVFVAVVGLIKLGDLFRLARISPVDFWVASATALIGVTAGLLPAVATGVVITLGLVLRELNTPRLSLETRRGDAIAVRIRQGLYTANVSAYMRAVVDLVAVQDPPVTAVVLDLRRMEATTITVLDALSDLDRELAAGDTTLYVAAVPAGGRRVAERVRWYQDLQEQGRVHATVDEALAVAAP
ncbi:SulP family inorganic anion transporter [Solicola gregarius]|uniref:SulP family inorganic anion transporter n=1 Tax=Solicola gregarius TaxID=2908642 RepID=A0AA46TFK6_9ACTN|nr:SulP family inorganic anion transporter [Solicola gregarius]UYM04330.1 SulP family inorganic anion transporter [Solicola gregarius]